MCVHNNKTQRYDQERKREHNSTSVLDHCQAATDGNGRSELCFFNINVPPNSFEARQGKARQGRQRGVGLVDFSLLKISLPHTLLRSFLFFQLWRMKRMNKPTQKLCHLCLHCYSLVVVQVALLHTLHTFAKLLPNYSDILTALEVSESTWHWSNNNTIMVTALCRNDWI